jgi:predicted glycoside hydrolase/deacetylase ChbG (UPF0249 family)
MKLIIHADDFGMADSINNACIELCRLGTLSSVSIMANMPHTSAIEQLKQIENISLGLHVTCTQGQPLSSPCSIPSLVTKHGHFFCYKELIARLKRHQIRPSEIETELRAQCEWLYTRIGHQFVFLDSHHSIHNKFRVFRDAFLRVQRDYPVSAIRTRQMFYLVERDGKWSLQPPSLLSTNRFGIRKWITNTYYRQAAKAMSKDVTIADGMIVEDKPGALDSLKTIHNIDLNIDDNRVFYIVVHPADAINDLPQSNLTTERLAEYEWLKTPTFVQYANEYKLIHFGIISHVKSNRE